MVKSLFQKKSERSVLRDYSVFWVMLMVMVVIYVTHTNQLWFYKINALHGYLPDAVWLAGNSLTYSRFFILPVLLLVITALWRRPFIWQVLFIIISYYVVFALLKHAVGELRPYMVLNHSSFFWLNRFEDAVGSAHSSFPSGHTGNAAVFVFSLIALFAQKKPWLETLLIALLVFIMLARICTGWHWPLDVLMSGVLGFVLVKIGFALPIRHSSKLP